PRGWSGAHGQVGEMTKTRAAAACAAAVVLAFGCHSPTASAGVSDATSIAMLLDGVPVTHGAIVGMFPGTTLHLSASIKASGGQVLSAARPSLVSRYNAAITIDANGVLRVVGKGSSWLVAGYNSTNRGLLSDSVTV